MAGNSELLGGKTVTVPLGSFQEISLRQTENIRKSNIY
jgi:hypothetical protein